jgi:bifunctional DNA-binding transcriptional regulator/antitoxin component of YhaV-PrlF toxin-antitoxin module
MVIQTKVKKWGNSLGVIIPAEAVMKLNLKPEQKIEIEVKEKKENILKELFGGIKFDGSIKQIIGENRKNLESKWMK